MYSFGNGCPWEFSGFLGVSIEVIETTGYRWGRNLEASSNHKVGCFRGLVGASRKTQILPSFLWPRQGSWNTPVGWSRLSGLLFSAPSLMCLLGPLTLQQGVCLSSRGQAESMVPGASSAWWNGGDLEFRLACVNCGDMQGKAPWRQHLSCLLSSPSLQQGDEHLLAELSEKWMNSITSNTRKAGGSLQMPVTTESTVFWKIQRFTGRLWWC